MILHIASDNTKYIIYPFIKFVNQHLNKNEHFFILCSKDKDIKRFENAITKDIFTQTNFFIQQMKKADKIFLHGFWYEPLYKIYKIHPEFFEKTIWRPWGGEYYFIKNDLQKWFIKNIKHIVHFMREEYLFIKNKYNINANYYEYVIYDLYSFLNTYKQIKNKKKVITIQVGNSSDPSNNHISIFLKLQKFKNIKVFCPLAYGNKKYKQKIIIQGKHTFNKNFCFLSKPLSVEEYIKSLNNMDIACFNHKRQQALGNIISLLILGKKVYLNHKVTTWKFFRRIGVKVYNINKNISLNSLNSNIVNRNRKILIEFFSKKRIKNDLNKLFRMSLD